MMNIGPAFWASTIGGSGVDPLFSYVVLLLHGGGTPGSTTLVNSASVSQSLTPNGNTQISSAQSKFGGTSIAFDGTNDVFTVAASASMDLTSGDFCVEMSVYLVAAAGTVLFDNGVGGLYNTQLWVNAANGSFGARGFDAASNLAFNLDSGASTATTGVWHHLALSRQGSVYRFFLNGALVASATNAAAMFNASGNASAVGAYYSGAASLNGFIDELRVTKGVARYTAAFTPPGAAHPDS